MNLEILKDCARVSLQKLQSQERQADISALWQKHTTPHQKGKKKRTQIRSNLSSTYECTENTEGKRNILSHNATKSEMWETTGQTVQFFQQWISRWEKRKENPTVKRALRRHISLVWIPIQTNQWWNKQTIRQLGKCKTWLNIWWY